jgi:hypothetical protein
MLLPAVPLDDFASVGLRIVWQIAVLDAKRFALLLLSIRGNSD